MPPLVADLFLLCYERDFLEYLAKEKQADMIDTFNSYSYLDDLLNIDNIDLQQMVYRIYPAEQILLILKHLELITLMVQFLQKYMIR